MSGIDLRLEITLANVGDGVHTTGRSSTRIFGWTVGSVELMLEYVELNSEAYGMISSQNARGYMISFISFVNYASTVDVGATNTNIFIPARYSSLKTLFSIYRIQSNIGLASVKTNEQSC
jgi:hypothetical protein